MRVALEHVRKSFGPQRVVDDVSLEVQEGELFFLLGPSGCGKTTLLRCIAGFARPDGGRVWLGGEDATLWPPHRRGTAMVFQSYALWPHMTVAGNVAFGLEQRRVPAAERAQRVAAALRLVRMEERAGARPAQLSGGQQQRVALARALVIQPRCLLLDEPLSNLDAKLRLEMRGEIRRICKEAGLTAVYVTHDQKEALSIADRIAVLHEGRLQQCGAPQEIYVRPRSRFVAHFIGETNFLEAVVAEAAFGRVLARSAIGKVVSAASPPEPLESGQKVTLSIRPEAVRLGAAPDGAANVFWGQVRDTVYLGEMAQREVAVLGAGAAELPLLAAAPPPAAAATLIAYELKPTAAAGQRIPVWFQPEDVVVLAR